jgi:hypothetical protein
MDLRDRFAVHFAAALVDALTNSADSGQIARRAYDLAEAMLVERARRIDAEEGSAIALEPRRLLDEPVLELDPGYDDDLDPSWLEPPYDPSWDVETRWSAPEGDGAPRQGPGLARTTPEAATGGKEGEERKERLA